MASALVGAGVSAIGSLVGAGKQKDAIKSASATQANAATANASLEKQATTSANAFTQGNLATTQAAEAPYQAAGAKALGQLSDGTAAGGEFNSTPTSGQVMAQDPGYGFAEAQGEQALQRAEAAGGGVGSGGALKAGVDYATNYATGAYGDAYSRFMGTREANYSNLTGIANYGQTANQVDANAGTAASANVANTTLAGTAAQTAQLNDAAQATAAGTIGVANGQSAALSQLGGAATTGINAGVKLWNGSGYGG